VRLAFAAAVALAAGVPASADAVSAVPVALTVSPAHAVLLAPSSRTLQVSNHGTERVALEVDWQSVGYRLGPNHWLSIAPRRLVLRGGARAVLTVRAGPGASPGDHQLLVLITGRPIERGRLAVQIRVGVRVRVRAPGRLVRKLVVDGLRARRLNRERALLVSLANRGNTTEQLRGRLTVTLLARNRFVSRLRLGRSRELYPGTRAVVALPYAGRARGVVTAIVTLRIGANLRPLERRYRLLL
jgi:hypothetical protein